MAKILYLSMSREKYSPNYFPFLRSYIDQVKSPDTEVDVRGTRVGRIDSFRFFETLDWISILDSVIEAELEGYDAVAIGNILDPALREARSMVDIPVLGLGETSMLTSCMMGSTFSLVGVNPYFGGRFEENVAKYGLRDRLASIESMGLTPHELDACFSDPDQRGKAIASFEAAARASLDQGRRGRDPCRRTPDGIPERQRHPRSRRRAPARRDRLAGRRDGGRDPHPGAVGCVRQPSAPLRQGSPVIDRRRWRGVRRGLPTSRARPCRRRIRLEEGLTQ